MDWLFGKSKSDEELIREYERSIKRTIRDISREIKRLEIKERHLLVDTKNKAKNKNYKAARTNAKNIIILRKNAQYLCEAQGRLETVLIEITTLKCQDAVIKSFRNTANIMARLNKKSNLNETRSVIEKFNKEKMVMEMKEELVLENLSDEDQEVQNDTEEVINKIFDEIGIELEDKLATTPSKILVEIEDPLFQRFEKLSQ